MSAKLFETTDTVAPSKREAAAARAASERVSRLLEADKRLQLSGAGESVDLPAPAARLLLHLLKEMGAGRTVTLTAGDAELSTQQAADLLDVSRPFIVKQMEQGRLPFRYVGNRRRVRLRDLMAYNEQIQAQSRQAIEELARLGQETGIGYD